MIKLSEYRSTDSNMILADVQMLANQLMMEHGLLDLGYFFNFDRSKSRFGMCSHKNKIISMSKYLTPGRTLERNRNTILHEIAHALTPGHGHDAVWKAKAIEIGCDGERCSPLAEVENKPEHRWTGYCENCDYKIHFHRAPNVVRCCTNCSPHGFDFRMRLSWAEFGEEKAVEDMPLRFREEFWKMWNFYNPKPVSGDALEEALVDAGLIDYDETDNSDGEE